MAARSLKSLINEAVRIKVVDIGANPIDSAPPYAGLLQAGDADVVGFEPNREALAILNTQRGPNETYLPQAVGDGKRHTLHLCAASGMTSLLEPNLKVLGLFHGFSNWARVVATEKLKTVRLDDVPETEGVDLIKIDIQGGELMVFKNATKRLADALVIHTEVEFMQMYVDQPLFSDVELFLRQHGFVFHRFFPLTSRVIQPMVVGGSIYSGLSQTLWADAIFVRDFSRLELMGDDQLLKMAVLVHDCYESIDLAYHLLLEHDRRTGGQRAATYLDALKGVAAQSAA